MTTPNKCPALCTHGRGLNCPKFWPAMHDLPLATEGLTSYRYRSRYGYIMIGAKDHPDALKQAARSTQDPISPDKLDVWNGQRYTPAIVATA